MIYCAEPIFKVVQYKSEMHSCMASQLWNAELMLSNSLDLAEWSRSVIFPFICEDCFQPFCAIFGLAHAVTMEDGVLWLQPTTQQLVETDVEKCPYTLLESPVFFPHTIWKRIRARSEKVPPADFFERAKRRDLAPLWIESLPAAVKATTLDEMHTFLRAEVVASDPIELPQALEQLRQLMEWMESDPDQPIKGRFVRSKQLGLQPNTIYLNTPTVDEWVAFAVGQPRSLGLGAEWMYLE